MSQTPLREGKTESKSDMSDKTDKKRIAKQTSALKRRKLLKKYEVVVFNQCVYGFQTTVVAMRFSDNGSKKRQQAR